MQEDVKTKYCLDDSALEVHQLHTGYLSLCALQEVVELPEFGYSPGDQKSQSSHEVESLV